MSSDNIHITMMSWTRKEQPNTEAIFCVRGIDGECLLRFLGHTGSDSGPHGFVELEEEHVDETLLLHTLHLHFHWNGSAALQHNSGSSARVTFVDGSIEGEGRDYSGNMISARMRSRTANALLLYHLQDHCFLSLNLTWASPLPDGFTVDNLIA